MRTKYSKWAILNDLAYSLELLELGNIGNTRDKDQKLILFVDYIFEVTGEDD